MMKIIVSYIGYVMGILGFAGAIWAMATKTAYKDYSVNDLKGDVQVIKQTMLTKKEFKKIQDSLNYHSIQQQDDIKLIIDKVNALRNSYVSHLRDNKSLTFDELVKYMNGIEFQLVYDTLKFRPDVKIKITPIKKK